MTELLDAAEGSPLLLAFVVVTGALVYAVEKLGGLDGPITRAVRAWQNRGINRLRREALLRAEQRRIEHEDDDERMRSLVAEVDWLSRERDDRVRRERVLLDHERRVDEYLRALLTASRRAGIVITDPPRLPKLAPLYARGDEGDEPPSTRPMRRESARPPVPRR